MHFFPTIIASVRSRYSGIVKVVDGFGFRHLSTDSIQHSGGIVTDIWKTALKPFAQKNKTWLVLGVAGGSVIKLISKKYSPKKITGVDLDKSLVDLGIKYFNLLRTKNLKIHIVDANKFCHQTKLHYDFILVDLFGRDSCPNFVYSQKFINQLLRLSSKIFINHLYFSKASINKYQKLIKLLTKLNLNFQTRQIFNNSVIYISTNRFVG